MSLTKIIKHCCGTKKFKIGVYILGFVYMLVMSNLIMIFYMIVGIKNAMGVGLITASLVVLIYGPDNYYTKVKESIKGNKITNIFEEE